MADEKQDAHDKYGNFLKCIKIYITGVFSRARRPTSKRKKKWKKRG